MNERDTHDATHAAETLRDPVCGMTVKPDTPHRLTHRLTRRSVPTSRSPTGVRGVRRG